MTPRVPLTGRQRLVYEFILDYITTNGYAPTFDEMSKKFGKALGTLHEIVQQIERRGWITRGGEPNSQRNIAIVPDVADAIEGVAKSLDGYAGQTADDWIIGILRGSAMKLREIADRARA